MEGNTSTPVRMQPVTDEERQALASKLDAELEDFINGLEKRRYAEGWPEDRWQEEMEKHPFFMTSVPEDGQEVSPLIQGLQQLKYDETDNTPTELAIAYKDDGNFNFKCRKYRFSIIGYTEGLMKKCGDSEVEAQLYNNRAAAHFCLNNYRSCIVDCKAALRLKPDYSKAHLRLAQSYSKLGKLQECIDSCNAILKLNADDKKATDIRDAAIKSKKLQDRDERKKVSQESKQAKEEERIKAAVKERGIKMVGVQEDVYPGAVQTVVHLVNDRLVWPTLFLYPEVATSDLVQAFHEDTTFAEQLAEVFETFPGWDVEKQYQPDRIKVYFECKDKLRLYPVDVSMTLGQVLADKRLIVRNGSPCFIIVVDGSSAEKRLIETYN